MIGIVDSIYEKYMVIELYSMQMITVPCDPTSEHTHAIHEGDILQFKNGQWLRLPSATNVRHNSIDHLINQLFINPS